MTKNKKTTLNTQSPTDKPFNTGIQRNAYQLTINNPQDHGFTHEVIRKTLIDNFPTLCFFCMADEKGSCTHTHIYVYLRSRVRWSKIAKYFPTAHIEIAHGTAKDNVDYIKKTGRWKDTDKSETSIPNTYEEFGAIPIQNGRNAEYEWIYQCVNAGMSNAEIIAMNNDFIFNTTDIDQLRLMVMKDKYSTTRRLDLKVTYCYGETGIGKTRGILDRFGDANVCRVTDYKRDPFSGYTSFQQVLMLDEYRSQFDISDLLLYIDIYPIELPRRYSNVWAGYSYVYIVSNISLEEQYPDVQEKSPETWRALLRRIHEVQIYQKDGTIVTYNSVEEYMKRKNEFHPVSDDITIPFDEIQKGN